MEDLWTWLEGLELSQHIGITWWFPLLESIHVVTLTFLVGSIFMVDLRLLGVSALHYPASRVIRDLIPWTWGAFFLTLPTGFGLFMTRAAHYAGNPAFRFKFLFLLLAGLNMAVFHLRSARDIADWDEAVKPPPRARLAGAAGLLMWAGVILAGRWTGHLN
ncbi:MAG: DUF6644 family protein [Thermoanaerobaculia bacterium]|nr:DUF6644 family protein [Thermoanaerobaculia bacterium]